MARAASARRGSRRRTAARLAPGSTRRSAGSDRGGGSAPGSPRRRRLGERARYPATAVVVEFLPSRSRTRVLECGCRVLVHIGAFSLPGRGPLGRESAGRASWRAAERPLPRSTRLWRLGSRASPTVVLDVEALASPKSDLHLVYIRFGDCANPAGASRRPRPILGCVLTVRPSDRWRLLPALAALVAVAASALLLGRGLGGPGRTGESSAARSDNPLAGQSLYVDPRSPAARAGGAMEGRGP